MYYNIFDNFYVWCLLLKIYKKYFIYSNRKHQTHITKIFQNKIINLKSKILNKNINTNIRKYK